MASRCGARADVDGVVAAVELRVSRRGRPRSIKTLRAGRIDDKARFPAPQRQRATFAPKLSVDHEGGAIRWRVALCDDDCGADAIFLECLGHFRERDQAAVGELADAARRVAGDAFADPRIVDQARIAIGREPFARRESVAAGAGDDELSARVAHGKTAPVGGDEDIRPWRAHRPQTRNHADDRLRPSAAASSAGKR